MSETNPFQNEWITITLKESNNNYVNKLHTDCINMLF